MVLMDTGTMRGLLMMPVIKKALRCYAGWVGAGQVMPQDVGLSVGGMVTGQPARMLVAFWVTTGVGGTHVGPILTEEPSSPPRMLACSEAEREPRTNLSRVSFFFFIVFLFMVK